MLSIYPKNVLPVWLQSDINIFRVVCVCASKRLKDKIEGGLIQSTIQSKHILHTAPHHDDIMLSYHSAMHYMLGRNSIQSINNNEINNNELNESQHDFTQNLLIKKRSNSFIERSIIKLGELYNNNVNHFAYLTSGFHSVNDDFLYNKINQLTLNDTIITNMITTGQLTKEYDELMNEFRDSFYTKNESTQDTIENIIFLRKIIEVWKLTTTGNYNNIINELKSKIAWIQNELVTHQPGDHVSL